MLPLVPALPYTGLIFSIHQPHCRALQLQKNDLSENFIKLVFGHEHSKDEVRNMKFDLRSTLLKIKHEP